MRIRAERRSAASVHSIGEVLMCLAPHGTSTSTLELTSSEHPGAYLADGSVPYAEKRNGGLIGVMTC